MSTGTGAVLYICLFWSWRWGQAAAATFVFVGGVILYCCCNVHCCPV